MKNNYQILTFFLAIAVLAAMLPVQLSAQDNDGKITFQGVLYEAGDPVTDTKQMVFSIAAVSWTETHTVNVVNGLYSVVLGENTPFPEDLFATSNSALLGISVTGSALPPVEIHAPFINKAIVTRNMPDQIDRVFDEDADEHSTLIVTASGTGAGQNSALEAVSETTDRNTGIEGFAISGDGNAQRQTGLYGQSQGTGSGNHRGVVGVALGGSGKYNKGIWGYAQGAGNGDTGQNFGEGSINFGVEGNATGNSWNNTGIEGSNFGEAGQWNFGIHGISKAGTGTSVENHGVAGRAYGPGINYGVYGHAGQGAENWAGWFEGDVKVAGNLDMDGSFDVEEISASTVTVRNASGEVKGELSVYPPNNAGSVVLYGDNNERNVILGSSSGGNRGFLGLYDPEGNGGVILNTSEDGSGNIYTYGNNQHRTGQFGGFSGNGFWKISDPNEDGTNTDYAIAAGFWAGEPEFIMERAQGEQGVKMRINAAPEGDDPDGWSGKMTLYGNNSLNVQLGGKHWENNNLPFLNFRGTGEESLVWMDVSQDTNTGAEWGNVNFSNTDGANTNVSADGIDLNGPNGEHFRLDYNGLGNNTRFSSLEVHNGNDNGEVVSAGQHGPNGNFGFMNIRGNNKDLVSLNADYDGDRNTEWGSINLQGQNSPNFRVSAKHWEDNNNGAELPYLAMNGLYTQNDGENDYHPDLVWMDVSQDTNTTREWGGINFSSSDGSNFGIDAYGFSGLSNSLEAKEIITLKQQSNPHNNSFEVYNNGDASYMNLNNSNNENSISLDGDAGSIDAKGSISNPRVELQRNWGNDGQGAVIVKDANDNWMIQASANDDGASNYNGTVTVFNSQNGFLAEMGGSGYFSIHDSDTQTDVISLNNNGDIYASTSVSTDGEMFADAFNLHSDGRLKKDVKNLDNSLGNIQKLRGVSYTWKDKKKSQKNQIGVIAQEVEEIYPEFVHTDKDGMKSVNYAQMTAVLIEAVKELTAKVTSLESENSDLKTSMKKLSLLESKINLLEKLLINKPVDASTTTAKK
ncbi:MAG: tail fiber domain-containing protein [Cyclobacteriaceae bacterium]